jgi:hypothetical protein
MQPQGTVYSSGKVCSLLDIPNTCVAPVPDVSSLKPGEVLLWYPGSTLTQLRSSPLGKELMLQRRYWYTRKNYAAELGYYAVQLRVNNSTMNNWREQQAILARLGQAYHPAPAAVAALALLVHLKETGSDLLQIKYCRCLEEAACPGCRVELSVNKGRVYVHHARDGYRYDYLWLAAARKF